jgi:hypothetical protein
LTTLNFSSINPITFDNNAFSNSLRIKYFNFPTSECPYYLNKNSFDISIQELLPCLFSPNSPSSSIDQPGNNASGEDSNDNSLTIIIIVIGSIVVISLIVIGIICYSKRIRKLSNDKLNKLTYSVEDI